MADVERGPTELVQVKVRLREHLRKRLDAEADRSGINLTTEVVRRLEKSLVDEEHERNIVKLKGGPKTERLCSEISKAIQFFGVDCPPSEEPLVREMLIGAITQILNERLSGWSGLMGQPSSEPRTTDQMVSAPEDLIERSRNRGALIGHHITLATRSADERSAAHASETINGETLAQSATRWGLIDRENEPALTEALEADKKIKKRA